MSWKLAHWRFVKLDRSMHTVLHLAVNEQLNTLLSHLFSCKLLCRNCHHMTKKNCYFWWILFVHTKTPKKTKHSYSHEKSYYHDNVPVYSVKNSVEILEFQLLVVFDFLSYPEVEKMMQECQWSSDQVVIHLYHLCWCWKLLLVSAFSKINVLLIVIKIK